jgi:arylsulfatase A-like enzyme
VHHGGRLHDGLLAVPLVVRWPRRLPGALVVRQRVTLVDVMPTVLALAAVPAPPGMRGRVLLEPGPDDRLDVPARIRREPRPAVAEESTFLVDPSGHRQASSVRQAAIYGHALKLIRAGGEVRLYDLARDPGETVDLAAARSADVSRLERRLLRILPALDAPGAAPRPEVVEQLRALGYVR